MRASLNIHPHLDSLRRPPPPPSSSPLPLCVFFYCRSGDGTSCYISNQKGAGLVERRGHASSKCPCQPPEDDLAPVTHPTPRPRHQPHLPHPQLCGNSETVAPGRCQKASFYAEFWVQRTAGSNWLVTRRAINPKKVPRSSFTSKPHMFSIAEGSVRTNGCQSRRPSGPRGANQPTHQPVRVLVKRDSAA